MFKLKRKIFWTILLVFLGLFFRTIGHIAPNIEYVTAASLLAGAYLGKKYAILVPLAIMVLSDTLIGNTNIFLFTWSAYLVIGLVGSKYLILNTKYLIPKATGLGIGAALWFFLWTNFGVWALDSWGMYPKTLAGLIESYLMGLPFLKLNLLGNLFFVPVSFGIVEMVKSFYASKSRNLNFLFRR
ncbi:MAG: hypothetical protein M1575_03385 [Patescibacteria group bacterium]|nr:hypothetical protein [Patescibacteria group bacterium]